MKTFKFYQDVRITAWERNYYTVEAKNYKKAIAKVKKQYSKGIANHEMEDNSIIFQNSEILCETIEDLPLKNNEGFSTCQWYDDDSGNLIYENGKKYINN